MTSEFLDFMGQIWRDQPSLMVFLALGFIVFTWLVVDSHRVHRARDARQRTGLY